MVVTTSAALLGANPLATSVVGRKISGNRYGINVRGVICVHRMATVERTRARGHVPEFRKSGTLQPPSVLCTWGVDACVGGSQDVMVLV